MTECFCQNCNLGDLGGKDKVRDNTIVLLSLTLEIRNYILNLDVHGVITETITIQSLRATEGIQFTFKLPLSSTIKFHRLTR